MNRVLVTGGAGFIGSNFIRHMLQLDANVRILAFDLLTYAGNLDNLQAVADSPNYRFYQGDVADSVAVASAFDAFQIAFGEPVEAVVHFAAESHVDRSIEDPSAFMRTNVLGTQVLLETARRRAVAKFVHISTDEVYGSLGASGSFGEERPLAPTNPYSASKASSDLVARAYFHTYGFPVVITRCSNNYGPYQFPEKLIPLMIAHALADKPLPVYGDGLHVRDWIHVEDHCSAVATVLKLGRAGEVYHIGGGTERTNLDVVTSILRMLGKPDTLIRFVPDRPGHDRRYGINSAKIERELGWRADWSFDRGLRATVDWYMANRAWVESVGWRRVR